MHRKGEIKYLQLNNNVFEKLEEMTSLQKHKWPKLKIPRNPKHEQTN